MNFITELICDYWKENEKRHRFVKVSEEDIDLLADDLTRVKPETPDWQIDGVLPRDNMAFVYHSFYACAVDFAFRHFEPPHEKFQVGKFSGSNAMGHCFYRRFGENRIDTEDILGIIESDTEFEKFFRGDNLPPLMEERRDHLHEAAWKLQQYFAGNPLNILRMAQCKIFGGSNHWDLGVVECLIKFFPQAFGQDHYNYSLHFNKRAQLWPLMYQGRALNSDGALPLLEEARHLGPIIDYKVPRALRHWGILEYSPELAERIDNWQPIEKHSQEEWEIRTAATYAVTELLRQTNQKLIDRGDQLWTMVELDYFLYSQKINAPHHLCRTTDY